MIERTAVMRIESAQRSETRTAVESMELAIGDEVDFHRPMGTKDEPGWRGPATLTEITDGQAVVKMQGRFHRVRAAELRRSLAYFTFLMYPTTDWSRRSPVETLIAFAESTHRESVRLGWIQSDHG